MNTGFLIQPEEKKEVQTTDLPSISDFPTVGVNGVFYKAIDTGLVYWYVSGDYEVVDPALDENNALCQVSGLPQATRPNPTDSPTYRVLNTTACPVGPSDEVALVVEGSYNSTEFGFGFEFNATLSDSLTNDLNISYSSTYVVDGVLNEGPSGIIDILAGNILGTSFTSSVVSGVVTDVVATINAVSPNPNGTKTIIY